MPLNFIAIIMSTTSGQTFGSLNMVAFLPSFFFFFSVNFVASCWWLHTIFFSCLVRWYVQFQVNLLNCVCVYGLSTSRMKTAKKNRDPCLARKTIFLTGTLARMVTHQCKCKTTFNEQKTVWVHVSLWIRHAFICLSRFRKFDERASRDRKSERPKKWKHKSEQQKERWQTVANGFFCKNAARNCYCILYSV